MVSTGFPNSWLVWEIISSSDSYSLFAKASTRALSNGIAEERTL